jgi:hypothetical protein
LHVDLCKSQCTVSKISQLSFMTRGHEHLHKYTHIENPYTYPTHQFYKSCKPLKSRSEGIELANSSMIS